nr:hypothetical protein [Nocardiopsis sp. TSRI0078]
MNSESRMVPGPTSLSRPITWSLTTFNQVEPRSRNPKYLGLTHACRFREGMTNRMPSAEAISQPPQEAVMSMVVWASMRWALAAVNVSARR